jgi:hypothetical protein
VEHNVCYNISNAGFFLHHGTNNRIINNVFADLEGRGRIGWGMYFTARASHGDDGNTATGNVVLAPSAKLVKATRHGTTPSDKETHGFVAIDKNLYWSRHGESPSFSISHGDEADGILDLASWQKLGYDRSSIIADPHFVDAAAHDYRLRSDSPAPKLGIQSIDTADVGLYGDAEWTGLPRRVCFRESDAESTFTPTRILRLDEDYEDRKVGYVPDHVQKVDREKGATIDVTDMAAADGQKCLRFVDAPGLEESYHPNRVWRHLRVDDGSVKLSFDCMNSRDVPATFSVEMRDWSERQYRTGPILLFRRDGRLRVGRDRYVPYELGQWYHVQIDFALGEGAPETYEFTFAPKGNEAVPATIPFSDDRFNVLTWFGLLVMDRKRHL